jgi:hypothetical protein
MQRAGIGLVALPLTQEAAGKLVWGFNSTEDIPGVDFLRRVGQLNPAPRSAHGPEQTHARQSLQDLGKVGGLNPKRSRKVANPPGCTFRLQRQQNCGPQGQLRRPPVKHK